MFSDQKESSQIKYTIELKDVNLYAFETLASRFEPVNKNSDSWSEDPSFLEEIERMRKPEYKPDHMRIVISRADHLPDTKQSTRGMAYADPVDGGLIDELKLHDVAVDYQKGTNKPLTLIDTSLGGKQFTLEELRIIQDSLNKNYATPAKLGVLTKEAKVISSHELCLCALAYQKSAGKPSKAITDLVEARNRKLLKNDYEKRLFTAAGNCDVKAMDQVLQEAKNAGMGEMGGIDSFRSPQKETLLMFAASGIRETEPPVEAKDAKHKEKVSFFAVKGKEETPDEKSYKAVEYLLNVGADVWQLTSDGRSVLMIAANFGHSSVVKRLIEQISFLPDRISYINRTDNAGKTAKNYAGQLGQYLALHRHIGGILGEAIANARKANMRLDGSIPSP